jgi:hypothetical protein
VDGANHGFEITKFGSKASNMYIHGAGASKVVVTPNLTEQLIPSKDPAWVTGQEAYQRKFLKSKV